MIILDSSVVLALAFIETGWDAVPWGQEDLYLPAVCLVEVVSKLVDRGHSAASIHSFLDPLGMTIAPLTENQALSAGLLRAATRRVGLSLGDRCCLALGMELGATVMTADRAWEGLDLGVTVQVIR